MTIHEFDVFRDSIIKKARERGVPESEYMECLSELEFLTKEKAKLYMKLVKEKKKLVEAKMKMAEAEMKMEQSKVNILEQQKMIDEMKAESERLEKERMNKLKMSITEALTTGDNASKYTPEDIHKLLVQIKDIAFQEDGVLLNKNFSLKNQ